MRSLTQRIPLVATKEHRRGIAVLALSALIVATLGAAAWAATTLQITQSRRTVDVARTFEVLVPAGSGIPGGAEPSPDGSNWPSVEWRVGEVRFQTRFVSTAVDPTAGVYNWLLLGPTLTNQGPGPVSVVMKGDVVDQTLEGSYVVPNHSEWLEPGESLGGWDLGWWGELANTGDWPHPLTEDESVGGEIEPLTITTEGGVTASGFYAWTFYYTAADQTGHFVFTLEMQGTR